MSTLRPSHALGPVTGALFVLSFRHGLWLFVIGIASLVVLLTRRHLQERRRWLPSLVAVRAIASTEQSGGDGTDITAAELVVLSKGHSEVLDRAASLAHQDGDSGRWSIAIASITVAGDLLRRGRVPGISEASGTSSSHVVLWGSATGIAFLGAVLTSSAWWLIALIVTYVRAVPLWTDWREERVWGPAMVAAAARHGPTQMGAADPSAVAAQLAALSSGHAQVLDRAQGLVEQWPGPAERKTSASQRLAMAAALLSVSGVGRATSRRAAVAWAATAVTVVATLVITT